MDQKWRRSLDILGKQRWTWGVHGRGLGSQSRCVSCNFPKLPLQHRRQDGYHYLSSQCKVSSWCDSNPRGVRPAKKLIIPEIQINCESIFETIVPIRAHPKNPLKFHRFRGVRLFFFVIGSNLDTKQSKSRLKCVSQIGSRKFSLRAKYYDGIEKKEIITSLDIKLFLIFIKISEAILINVRIFYLLLFSSR